MLWNPSNVRHCFLLATGPSRSQETEEGAEHRGAGSKSGRLVLLRSNVKSLQMRGSKFDGRDFVPCKRGWARTRQLRPGSERASGGMHRKGRTLKIMDPGTVRCLRHTYLQNYALDESIARICLNGGARSSDRPGRSSRTRRLVSWRGQYVDGKDSWDKRAFTKELGLKPRPALTTYPTVRQRRRSHHAFEQSKPGQTMSCC